MTPRLEELLEKIRPGSLFGYVQCGIEVPGNLLEASANFPPIFKNINVERDDIGPFMEKHAEKEGISTQPRRLLRSSYILDNGTIITPFASLLSGLGASLQKKLSLCAIHSDEVLQQLRSICIEH